MGFTISAPEMDSFASAMGAGVGAGAADIAAIKKLSVNSPTDSAASMMNMKNLGTQSVNNGTSLATSMPASTTTKTNVIKFPKTTNTAKAVTRVATGKVSASSSFSTPAAVLKFPKQAPKLAEADTTSQPAPTQESRRAASVSAKTTPNVIQITFAPGSIVIQGGMGEVSEQELEEKLTNIIHHATSRLGAVNE